MIVRSRKLEFEFGIFPGLCVRYDNADVLAQRIQNVEKTIVLSDVIGSVLPDDGARDSDSRVERVLEKLDSARCEVLKSITLEDIRSPEAKAADVIQARAADESQH